VTTTPYAVAARELLRSTLLDAMREQLQERGWAEVTMAEIATAAGVSRQTLYKEFGSRQELAQAYVLHEVDRFLVTVEEAVAAHLDDPVGALAAAFDVFLAVAANDPLVREVVAGDGGELLPLVTTRGDAVIDRATERLTAFLVAGWPALGEGEARLLADAVVRLAISYAALPNADVTGASIASLLGPSVERALSGARR
jgi:AcrR family transcriptional regulator